MNGDDNYADDADYVSPHGHFEPFLLKRRPLLTAEKFIVKRF
jgi:hypothetical protein